MLISLALLAGSLRKMLTVPYQSAVRSLWSPPRYSDPLSVDPELRLQLWQTANKLGNGQSQPFGTQKVKMGGFAKVESSQTELELVVEILNVNSKSFKHDLNLIGRNSKCELKMKLKYIFELLGRNCKNSLFF